MHIALYQPDIALNVGAAIRLCACLDTHLDIIEPCGFPWNRAKIRQSALDYIDAVNLTRHASWQDFSTAYPGQRRILLSTRASEPYTDFEFHPDDILLAGRESAGVPDFVHDTSDARILIPMKKNLRSLNLVNSISMILGEALRQTEWKTDHE